MSQSLPLAEASRRLRRGEPAQKLCACGCGTPTAVAKRNIPRLGHIKGEFQKFARGHKYRVPVTERFWAKVEKTDDCWLWRGARQDPRQYARPYGVFAVRLPGQERTLQRLAHRVAWIFTHGSIEPGQILRHTCHEPVCVRPEHLRIGGQSENALDDLIAARHQSKFTPAMIMALRADRAAGMSHGALATKYGVSYRAARDVASGRTWRHVR